MKVNVLKRLPITSRVTDLSSNKREYRCEIEMPTLASGILFKGDAYSYDSKDKNFVKNIDINVVSNGTVSFYKIANPIYEKAYDKNADAETKKQLKEALDKDRKEFKGLAEKINKIYEQAERDVLDVLESAGYLEV